MAITPVAKLGIGALTLGAVGTTGYLGATYLKGNEKEIDNVKETTIKDLINKEYNHILLKTTGEDDNKDWETNWAEYKKISDQLDSDIFGLVGWKKNSPDKLIDKLKTKCGELANKLVPNSNDDNYKNVTKYCARNVTIKDQAGREQLTIISDQNGGNSSWDEVAGKKATLTTHFTNLKIVATDSSAGIKGADVKKGCEAIVTKNKSESDYQTTYDSYKEVCVKK